MQKNPRLNPAFFISVCRIKVLGTRSGIRTEREPLPNSGLWNQPGASFYASLSHAGRCPFGICETNCRRNASK